MTFWILVGLFFALSWFLWIHRAGKAINKLKHGFCPHCGIELRENGQCQQCGEVWGASP